jgi:hypothetical protein
VLDGVFCEGEPEVLGDGRAPWSGFSSASASASGSGPASDPASDPASAGDR